MFLGHGAGGTARLAGGEVDQLDYVHADELVDLGASDGAAERALDRDQGALAEGLGDVFEELLGVHCAELL